jgi:hypothetical protein
LHLPQQLAARREDEKNGEPPAQVRKQQASRFTAFLRANYGGADAIRAFLETGLLQQILLPPLRDDDQRGKRRQVAVPGVSAGATQRRPGHSVPVIDNRKPGSETRAKETAKYFDSMLRDITDGNTDKRKSPMFQSLLFIIQKRCARKGQSPNHLEMQDISQMEGITPVSAQRLRDALQRREQHRSEWQKYAEQHRSD